MAAKWPMDTTASLNLALAGRYSVERELGRGGMATVYPPPRSLSSRYVAPSDV